MANSGSYTLTSNDTSLDINGEITGDELITIEANLNNANYTLTVAATADENLFPTLVLNSDGTITDGVIQDLGGGLVAAGGTLDNVTYEGALTLTSSTLYIDDGFTAYSVNGPGTGPGAVTLGSAQLYLDNTETLDDDVITMTGGALLSEYTTYAAYNSNASVSPAETLTFGASLVIDQTAGYGSITQSGYYTDGINPGAVTIVNDGQINVQGSGSTLEIYPQIFTNTGTLDSEGTDTSPTYLWVYSSSFTNTGTIDVSSGDTFELGNGASYTYTTTAAFGGTINAAAGFIELNGTLINTGATLKIGAANGIGTLYLTSSATVSRGIIADSGSGLESQGGEFDDVVYQGTLALTTGNLFIDDGLTAQGTGGTGPGVIDIGSAQLLFESTQTFGGATITMTSGSQISLYTTSADYSGNGSVSPPETLTFASDLVINQTTGSGNINLAGYYDDGANFGSGMVVNDGEINVQGSGTILYIYPDVFDNAGTLNSEGTGPSGSTLYVYSGVFTNTGTIDVSSGNVFELGNSASVTYTTSAAFGGTINASAGTIELNATLNNAGSMLKIGAGEGIGTFELTSNSTVTGGIIFDAGSGLAGSGGTLTNLTYEGPLTLTSGYVYLDDNVTFTGATGTGPGAITLGSASLYVDNTQTLDDETITLTGGAELYQETTYAAYLANGSSYPTETLTLAAKLVIDATSGANYLNNSGYYTTGTDNIVNDGLVEAQGYGSTLYIDNGPGPFLNNNILEANDLGTIYYTGGVIAANISADTHYSGDVLTGGTYEVTDGAATNTNNANSSIEFYQSGALAITTLAATVDLTGANAILYSAGTNLDASLRDVAVGGSLNLYYDSVSNTQADFNNTTSVPSLAVDGALGVYGSILQVGSLVIDSTGIVTAVGESNAGTAEEAQIVAPITNTGILVAGLASQGNPAGAPEAHVYIGNAITNSVGSAAGTIEIEGSTVLELSGAAKGGQIVFENTEASEPATLALDATALSGAGDKITSTIAGFEAGDVIDLTKLANATFKSFSGETLSFTVGSTTDTLTLSGIAAGSKFTFASDGGSVPGTDITVACYGRGTRIATARGDVAIESLTEGDLVRTASGALRPLVWIGHRLIDTTRHPDPRAVWPVRISADAFGVGLPARDLWLSPGHNIAALGVLAPASALLNGLSVSQVAVDSVEYWHVELDAHDVILAEGLPAESYLDTGNRCAFANGGAFVEAFPDFQPKHWTQTCLPIALSGPKVTEIKSLLVGRLRAQGYAIDGESDAHLLADGERIAPLWTSARRLAFVVPEGRRSIALQSRVFTPAYVSPESSDVRTLGLCVARLEIDGDAIALDRDAGPGWLAAETTQGRFSHRWTDGSARLREGARIVIVDLAGEGHYGRDALAGLRVAAE